MAVFKGFVAYVVDSSGENALENLGTFVLSVQIGNRDLSYRRVYSFSDLESHVDDAERIATAMFQIQGVSDTEARYNAILNVAPVTKLLTLSTDYAGNRIKLINSTGFYALSDTLPAYPGILGSFDLYDNNDTLLARNISITGPMQYGEGINVPIFESVDASGNVSGIYRDLSISTRISGSQYIIYASITSQGSNLGLANWINGLSQYVENPDPYSQGGESDIGGGTGNFDGTSVDVDFTSLPNLSAVDTGFITLYNPTVAQLQALANYMWSGAFDLDTFKKLFADPMQAILGLSIVPGPVPSSGSQAVKVGNISTGISMTKAASQYIDVDCGTLNVEEFWGAYLDYEPYTKAEIYLPYIGTHQIAVDDIMGKAVHIKYHIDILSGACAAEIKCGGSVLYTFIGSVAVSIPVTGNDWTNVINGVLSIAGAVGSLVATGGAAAPAAAGEIASAAVNSLKPNIEKSGSVSGGGGLMAGKVPVLILTRPRQALPASQNSFTGYPAFITRSLGSISGYTEVHKIRLGGISATDTELDEIKNLLKGGVIL